MRNVINSGVFRQYAVAFAINLNCLSFGLGMSWPSPVIVKLTNGTEKILSEPFGQEDASWIVSTAALTGALGFLSSLLLIDTIGRKYCAILSSLVRLIAALMYLLARRVWMLILGRVFEGLSQGIILGAVPPYVSEIASKETRGSLGVMLQIFASIGTVIMLSVGPFISYFNLNLMFTLVTVVTSVPTLFLPDSPSFLYSKGKHEESKKALVFLRCSEIQANEELKEYSMNRNTENRNIISIFRNKLFMKCFGKSVFVCSVIYLIGFHCVMGYLQTILDDTHTNIRSEVASGIIGGIQLLASFSTLLLTDTFGRKPIFVGMLLGTSLGLVGLGTFFKLAASRTEVTGFLNFLPLFSLVVVVFCYSAGPGSLLWVLIAELFDDHSRGVGTTASLTIGAVPSFLTVRYFSTIVNSIGPAPTFWIAAGFSVALGAFIWFRIPETKGKSFADIQKEIRNSKS